jgi:hypothetical protein
LAEGLKGRLVAEYGVEAHRVNIIEEREVGWAAGRLSLWVIPEKGRWPDT